MKADNPASAYPSLGGDGDTGGVVALVEGWEDPPKGRQTLCSVWDGFSLFRDRLDLLVRILLRMFPHRFEECLCRNPA